MQAERDSLPGIELAIDPGDFEEELGVTRGADT